MVPSGNVALRPRYALFDLDFTLFAAAIRMLAYNGPTTHLRPAQVDGLSFIHYLINAQVMEKIFKALQEKNVVIGFITASNYNPIAIKKFFERVYNLPADSLKDAPFIGRDDFGNAQTDKGIKISAAQMHGTLSKDADITLIDDDEVHIASVQGKYTGILVRGLPDPNSLVSYGIAIDHSYLLHIIEHFGLNISLAEHSEMTRQTVYTPLLQGQKNQRLLLKQQQEDCTCLDCARCLGQFMCGRLFCC